MKKTAALLFALSLVAVASCKRGEQPASSGFATDTATTQASGTAQAATEPGTTTQGTGTVMPEYTALNLDGSKFDLASKRDKVVLINVWATWCVPCRYEIPELQALHEQYTPRGFEVIGVSVDESGPEALKSFIAEQKKMTYPVVLDAEGKIANMLQTSVLPTSILVDRKGNIVWKKFGLVESKDEQLKQAIEAAL